MSAIEQDDDLIQQDGEVIESHDEFIEPIDVVTDGSEGLPESADDQPQAEEAAIAPQYGVGPFSIREVSLFGVWFVAFATSFFSLSSGPFSSVWTSGILWLLTIGLPSVAVFLVVLRRLSPDGIRRVGSLGIDQFASVAFSVSTVLWIQLLWENVTIAAETGIWVRTWVAWVQAIFMLAGVVLTVVAPVLPVLGEDFRHRREIVAHQNARPLRPVLRRPPVVVEPTLETSEVSQVAENADEAVPSAVADFEQEVSVDNVNVNVNVNDADADAERDAELEAESDTEAFWALVPEERDVVDVDGTVLFRISPAAWALVIEDRGESFVVLHEDGRSGVLHNVTGITRG